MRSNRHLDCWILPLVFLPWLCQLGDLIQYSKSVTQSGWSACPKHTLNLRGSLYLYLGETVVCTVLRVVVTPTPATSVCSLNVCVRWCWLTGFQIPNHYVFTCNACKISFYFLIKFEGNIYRMEGIFGSLVSFSTFFFSLSSRFMKQIVTDFLPCCQAFICWLKGIQRWLRSIPYPQSCIPRGEALPCERCGDRV